jgi:hypothetical protein
LQQIFSGNRQLAAGNSRQSTIVSLQMQTEDWKLKAEAGSEGNVGQRIMIFDF